MKEVSSQTKPETYANEEHFTELHSHVASSSSEKQVLLEAAYGHVAKVGMRINTPEPKVMSEKNPDLANRLV